MAASSQKWRRIFSYLIYIHQGACANGQTLIYALMRPFSLEALTIFYQRSEVSKMVQYMCVSQGPSKWPAIIVLAAPESSSLYSKRTELNATKYLKASHFDAL